MHEPVNQNALDLDDLQIADVELAAPGTASLEIVAGSHLMTEVGASSWVLVIFCCSCSCCVCG